MKLPVPFALRIAVLLFFGLVVTRTAEAQITCRPAPSPSCVNNCQYKVCTETVKCDNELRTCHLTANGACATLCGLGQLIFCGFGDSCPLYANCDNTWNQCTAATNADYSDCLNRC